MSFDLERKFSCRVVTCEQPVMCEAMKQCCAPVQKDRRESERRAIENETNKEAPSGTSKAVSSHSARYYHLIDPDTIRRLGARKTGGGKKYGWVQWRMGINDVEYVTDRYNHLWEHLLLFQQEGNRNDDNIGAMLWALDCLCAVERLCPGVLDKVVGTSELFGKSAEEYHEWQKQTMSHLPAFRSVPIAQVARDTIYSNRGTGVQVPCRGDNHVWSNQYGDDWSPEVGRPCDCGMKTWKNGAF